jgi:hypothetical protein
VNEKHLEGKVRLSLLRNRSFHICIYGRGVHKEAATESACLVTGSFHVGCDEDSELV